MEFAKFQVLPAGGHGERRILTIAISFCVLPAVQLHHATDCSIVSKELNTCAAPQWAVRALDNEELAQQASVNDALLPSQLKSLSGTAEH